MPSRPLPRWLWPVFGLALALAGALWLLRADATARREAFDTDARIAHRLLSQQAVQHDAMLSTLALLQPGAGLPEAADAAQRLPALYPQVLQVLRRGRGEPWPVVGAVGAADLAAAEAESARSGRAVVTLADASTGQYTLLRAGEPASYALRLDARRTVPWAEWPLAADGPVQAQLLLGGQPWFIQPGRPGPGVAQLQASKRLASESQAFELTVSRHVAWAELPWAGLLLWCAAAAATAAALAAWQRQRDAARRAQELLRMGQVGRLNALGELAAGMAHELNQPLTAVLASTQAAQRLLADDDPEGPDLATARQALAQGAQQARRAADVVSRLRRLVQAPDADAAPQTLPLAACVRSVLDLMQPAGLQLDLSGLDDTVRVRADPVALEQVLHNLLLNAQQALERMPAAQRRLAVSCRAEGAQVRLCVQDSGPGFPPEALQRAFEPFFTTRPGGLGLGLSLCDTLAAGMGGSLAARNRDEGGAELTLTLPTA